MHTKHVIDLINTSQGVLVTEGGIRFLLTNPVPEFVAGWAHGDHIWVSETDAGVDICTASEMLEMASAIRS